MSAAPFLTRINMAGVALRYENAGLGVRKDGRHQVES